MNERCPDHGWKPTAQTTNRCICEEIEYYDFLHSSGLCEDDCEVAILAEFMQEVEP